MSGALSADAIERTARAVANFANEAKAEKCDVVYAFATEAVRSASNGAEFVARCVRDGVKVDVLPGGDEAKLGFWGAYSGGRQAVLDIGGASTELAIGSESGLEYGKSLHIGSVRIRDLCGEDIAAIKALAASTVEQYGAVPTFDKLISIGGTGSTLVSVDKAMKVYDTTRVHGAVLTRARVEEIAMEIHSVPMARAPDGAQGCRSRRGAVDVRGDGFPRSKGDYRQRKRQSRGISQTQARSNKLR